MYNRSIVQACRYDEISFYKKETDNYENCSQISSLFRRCHDRNSFEADSSGDLVRGIIYTGVQDQRALYSGGKERGEKKSERKKIFFYAPQRHVIYKGAKSALNNVASDGTLFVQRIRFVYQRSCTRCSRFRVAVKFFKDCK